MRIVSFLAASSKQAMNDLRASLGDEAIILSTRTLDDGRVSVTGAVPDDLVDLVDVLDPPDEPRSLEWLAALADFHEWPFRARERIEPILENVRPAEPETVLTTLVQARFHFDSSCLQSGRPLLLSGPPGSGKTVTMAKLAARQVLAGRSVDIVTLDSDRAGSLDRLTTLLAPLDLTPIPVAAMSDLPAVLGMCRGDMVMVDSASANPFDPADLGRTSTLAARTGGELVLVLPAGLGVADSAEIARSYMALGARGMVITKLDAARRFGGMLAAAEAGLAFTDAGIGPSIGDGLCSLTASGMARLLLRRYYGSIDEERGR